MSQYMNNGNLWLVLLLLVVVSFMAMVQHSTTPPSATSLAGARLRVREQSIQSKSGHGHDHGDDWIDPTNTPLDVPPVVASPYATLWHDEDADTPAADGYRPPRQGSLAARFDKRRTSYYNQRANNGNGKNDDKEEVDEEEVTTTRQRPQPIDIEQSESSTVPSSSSSEPVPTTLSPAVLAAMPPLATFSLDTRIWPLPKSVEWPAAGAGSVALISPHVHLVTNVGDDVIDALWPLIFTTQSGTCASEPSITILSATADQAPTNERDDCPHGDNEGYELTVTQTSVTIKAASQWGIINGLKSLTHLIQWRDSCAYVPNVPVIVTDEARFPIRGFLIDSPRAWIELQQVRAVIDRMAVMKLNVLHMRLTDDQSFLIESKRYPGLNQGQPHTYKQDDIKKLVSYARARGVRIIPEIDVPGHSKSWAQGAHPELVANCPNNQWSFGLDPTIEFTWTVVREFIEEIFELFIDPIIHLGGDEVSIACYDQDKQLMNRARAKGWHTGAQVLEGFTARFHELLTNHPPFAERTIILWEDLYENHKQSMSVFRKDIIFHTWLSTKNCEEVADHGFRCVRSTYLYFNEIHAPDRHYEFYTAFKEMYSTDWYQLNFFQKKWPWKDSTRHLFNGAIACIWENPYSTYAIKVWPLIPAAAERLWSAPQPTYDMDAVHKRLTSFQSYVESLQLDVRHATSGGEPLPAPDYDSIRRAAGAKLGARDP